MLLLLLLCLFLSLSASFSAPLLFVSRFLSTCFTCRFSLSKRSIYDYATGVFFGCSPRRILLYSLFFISLFLYSLIPGEKRRPLPISLARSRARSSSPLDYSSNSWALLRCQLSSALKVTTALSRRSSVVANGRVRREVQNQLFFEPYDTTQGGTIFH